MIEAVGFGGQVRIRSVRGHRYLCVSGHGSFIVKVRLYRTIHSSNMNTSLKILIHIVRDFLACLVLIYFPL